MVAITTDSDGNMESRNFLNPTLLSNYYNQQMETCSQCYEELVMELFFLQHGGNYMDFNQFKKRPPQQLLDHLRQNPIILSCDKLKTTVESEMICKISNSPLEQLKVKENSIKLTPIPSSNFESSIIPRPALADVYEDAIGSQEEILGRAKEEALILKRVAELRKQGLWSQRRLPKIQEPLRNKAHWDYMLEEMRWLAADFAQERKWKRIAAKKLARMVSNYHKDRKEKEKKQEREGHLQLRRIASAISRSVRSFWNNIEKVVEYKQRSLMDEQRKKALDLHLNYIVDQTAKYSDWLTQGLTQSSAADGAGSSSPQSKTSSQSLSDDDFMPQAASSDDEETIDIEEQAISQENVNEEIEKLKLEGELPFEDLLSQLPLDLIESIGKPISDGSEVNLSDDNSAVNEESSDKKDFLHESSQSINIPTEFSNSTNLNLQASDDDFEESFSSDDEERKRRPILLRRSARKRSSDRDDNESTATKRGRIEECVADVEFNVADEDSNDDEATLQEQEENENVDHAKELQDLQAENDMPIEELMKLYGGNAAAAAVVDTDVESAAPSEDEKEKQSLSDDDNEDGAEQLEEIGMDYLLKMDQEKEKAETEHKPEPECKEESGSSSPSKEITDVAAEALSLQPTGHTLATSQVVTPIPSLLKHTLREYQHIGLDWLVTMYSKRLNGILADEMGLGKTIQTIALLAHLACEKGVWGPHLIVVPTSVMLNWEMEFKKWCPGFKILTYYGSQKERKLKRSGWTKSNAFHVCITSYKLVVQDHGSFRRKKWRYLILDEAQNIKNFKSQRWQSLLNFNSQRRLLLTGTPLQNNLMELWSLMHFLMPHVFQSHKEFKEWFSNPMTGMIEGAEEFNEKLIRRLHKVLRPFLLRRIKKDVEKQMPNKYEHVVRCHLSKRQRFLYEDFMSRAATKDTLAGGHFMSVINVLMQLRKVCNHPNLFEPRPICSSFCTPCLDYIAPSAVANACIENPFQKIDLPSLNLHLLSMCQYSTSVIDALQRLSTPCKIIEEIYEDALISLQSDGEEKEVVSDRARAMVYEKILNRSSITEDNQVPTDASPRVVASQSYAGTDARLPPTGRSLPTTVPRETSLAARWQTVPNGQVRRLPDGGDSSCKRLPAESYSRMIVRLKQTRRDRSLARSARLNQRRCDVTSCPLSSNLIDKVESITACNGRHSVKKCFSSWQERTRQFDPLAMSVLDDVIKSPMQRLEEMRDILERYVFLVPKVLTPTAKLKIGHQPAWKEYSLKLNMTKLRRWLVDQSFPLRRVMQNQTLQFPEARLIQYDCGKLQVLSVLLRQFWAGKHRILIFTQMTRVLDILEAFLNYHGYRYLRLDGSTAIEQRMSRMERFNNDPRIFCFILSTRSGGIGVNLTGADTVVFYDSDWNPTMDAQAQDRCHRIGQTRDVHIYRLISDRTIEENILKKANQKRLLGDLAIEGGSFTTAFFKSQAIKDIFDEPSGLEELTESSASQQPATSRPLTARQKALEAAKTKEVAGGEEAAHVESNEKAELERALLESEDKEDAAAATLLKEEQNAVLEEFTEEERGISEAGSVQDKSRGGTSRVEEELLSIYNELNPIEQYALKFLELSADQVIDLQLQQAEAQVERSKKDWELTHLVALKEEEERRLEDEEDEIFYTREDQPEIEVRKRKGGKKRKRKDRDICFLDMSSSDSDETYRDEVELMEYDEADRRDVDDDEERRDVEDEVERPDVDDEERRDDDNKKEDEVEVAEQVKPLHLPPKRVKRDTTRGTARRGRGRSSTGLGRNMRGRGRGGGPVVVGRGRRGRGARAVPTQARLPSSSSSSSEDDASQPKPAQPPKARENPLWIEYGEELADYLRDDDDERQWSDNSLLTSSNDDHLLTDDDDGAEPRRQQTVIRDADRTEKLLQSAQRRQLDFGPCEIMSFSKSGRARKRNSRFCDDEYEVFGPGTAATIPRASPRPSLEHQSVYNVVVETPLRSQPPPCNPQPATHKPMRKQATVQQQQQHQTSVQNRNVFSAFSVLDSGGKLHNLPKVVQPPAPQRLAPATAPITFRHVAQPQQLSVIRLAHVGSQNVMVTQALQQAPHARPQSIFIQQGANMPLQQIRIIGANSLTHNSPRQLPPGPALLQPPPAPPAAQRKSHGGASRKPWSGNTRVVDCHNMMEGSGKASLFDALQEEMGSEDDELMVTLDMEPVSCLDDNGNDQFLAPENEEERNVFESFQSLLQS